MDVRDAIMTSDIEKEFKLMCALAGAFGSLAVESTPTTETEELWIHATNNTNQNNQPPHPENWGMWLIYMYTDQADRWWPIIKKETEAGNLGFATKSTTKKTCPDRSKGETGSDYVVAVCTYDYTDKADVMRVRNRLRELGIGKIVKYPYYTDAQLKIPLTNIPNPAKLNKYYE